MRGLSDGMRVGVLKILRGIFVVQRADNLGLFDVQHYTGRADLDNYRPAHNRLPIHQ